MFLLPNIFRTKPRTMSEQMHKHFFPDQIHHSKVSMSTQIMILKSYPSKILSLPMKNNMIQLENFILLPFQHNNSPLVNRTQISLYAEHSRFRAHSFHDNDDIGQYITPSHQVIRELEDNPSTSQRENSVCFFINHVMKIVLADQDFSSPQEAL